MQKFAIVCDGCGTEKERPDLHQTGSGSVLIPLPNGWLRVDLKIERLTTRCLSGKGPDNIEGKEWIKHYCPDCTAPKILPFGDPTDTWGVIEPSAVIKRS